MEVGAQGVPAAATGAHGTAQIAGTAYCRSAQAEGTSGDARRAGETSGRTEKFTPLHVPDRERSIAKAVDFQQAGFTAGKRKEPADGPDYDQPARSTLQASADPKGGSNRAIETGRSHGAGANKRQNRASAGIRRYTAIGVVKKEMDPRMPELHGVGGGGLTALRVRLYAGPPRRRGSRTHARRHRTGHTYRRYFLQLLEPPSLASRIAPT